MLNSKDPKWQTRNPNCPVSPNQPPIASFTATPSSGTLDRDARCHCLYRSRRYDCKGTWNSVNLTENGGTWTGNFAATAETEFFVQAVDNTGNVAVNDNGGEYFSFKAIAPSRIPLPPLGNGFAGGIAVNGNAYQQRVIQNLADTVDVTGEIQVDPAHTGQPAAIFVYAKATLPPSPETYYFMLGESLNILVWDKNPANLATFMPVTWGTTQTVSMYQGTFFYPGTLKVYFGYRLMDGTVVTGGQPIDMTILP